ncbi:MAG: hypothetical protein M3O41_14280 [Pseudomonadota bacterium]|nr:hypothetical protein [Pseudomonadota bacterium]
MTEVDTPSTSEETPVVDVAQDDALTRQIAERRKALMDHYKDGPITHD